MLTVLRATSQILATSMPVSPDRNSRMIRSRMLGGIAEIVPAADTDTRTFLIKVDLPRECNCRSGQYGTAAFPMGEEKRLTVPRQAIIEHGGLEGVYIVNKEGKSEYRLVKTGKTVGERVEILAGLADGDRVATSQIERLQDGARVEVQ